jgi:hypothetical protein
MGAAAIIATGADQRYWHCLWQFLGNAEARGLPRAHRLIAYDLGLEAAARARLEARYSWCEFRDFPFAGYPPHVAMAAGSYAFKPLIVERLMEETNGLVFWFDSATLFRVSDLSFLAPVIRANGLYVLRGQTPLEQRCDPSVLERLQIPFSIRRRPELAAGVLGFDAGAPAIRALVREWAELARSREHIAPRIPRLSFHRPEQALLTFLVYREEALGTLRLTGEEIDISSASPVRWMRSRNFIGPRVPTWAGPFVRLRHAAYKKADQALWKLKHWQGTRLHGLHRRLKEHFTILLRDAAGKTWRLRAPAGFYLADPFLVRHQGRRALLVERFDYRTNKGDLCAIALDDPFRPGPLRPILPGRAHTSFPFTFTHDARLYLVPETSAEGSVEIHACEEFPASWRLARMVLEDIDAADSVIFPRDGLWWLVTAVREDSRRHLQIHFTDDPLQGRWQAHPVNQARLWQGAAHSSGRNAGAVIEADGVLYRPAQKSRRFYGEDLQWMRIETLTPTAYRERPDEGPPGLRALVADWSPHHLSLDDGLAVFDIRDRARTDWGLPLRRPRRPPPDGDIPIPPPHAKVP